MHAVAVPNDVSTLNPRRHQLIEKSPAKRERRLLEPRGSVLAAGTCRLTISHTQRRRLPAASTVTSPMLRHYRCTDTSVPITAARINERIIKNKN